MAAVTPTAFTPTADGTTYIDPYNNIRAQEGLADERTLPFLDLIHRVFHIVASDADNFVSGIPSIIATATQSDTPATETMSSEVTTQATGDIRFQTSGAGLAFWLHIWSRSS